MCAMPMECGAHFLVGWSRLSGTDQFCAGFRDWTHLREAHEAETFFYAFTALIVAGTKAENASDSPSALP